MLGLGGGGGGGRVLDGRGLGLLVSGNENEWMV